MIPLYTKLFYWFYGTVGCMFAALNLWLRARQATLTENRGLILEHALSAMTAFVFWPAIILLFSMAKAFKIK